MCLARGINKLYIHFLFNNILDSEPLVQCHCRRLPPGGGGHGGGGGFPPACRSTTHLSTLSSARTWHSGCWILIEFLLKCQEDKGLHPSQPSIRHYCTPPAALLDGVSPDSHSLPLVSQHEASQPAEDVSTYHSQ